MAAFQIPSSSEITPAVRRAIDAAKKFGESTFLPLVGGALTGGLTGTVLTLNGGLLQLSNAVSNRIQFANAGVAAPSFTTRSIGTKIVLWDGISGSAADYAIGIDGNTQWFSVPTTSQQFKWYAGTTNIATLSGVGDVSFLRSLTVSSTVDANIHTTGSGAGFRFSDRANNNNSSVLYRFGGTNYIYSTTSGINLVSISDGGVIGCFGATVNTGLVSFAGSNGVNWSAYGGSIWMQDTTWVRTDKSFYNGGNTLANDGHLSIGYGGATDPTYRARVNGNMAIAATLLCNNISSDSANNLTLQAGGANVLVSPSGSLTAIASTAGYQAVHWGTTFGNYARFTSKRALKENITPIVGSGAIIDALRPVTFIPKATCEETDELRYLREQDVQYGFIAEEVAEVADGKLTVWEPDDELYAVPVVWKQYDMIALVVAEVKDLRARVTFLENSCGT